MSQKKTSLAENMVPMDSPGGRLSLFLLHKGLSQNQVAVACETHASTIKSYLSNSTEPKRDFLDRLSDIYGLSPAWVDYGIEPMFLTGEPGVRPLQYRDESTRDDNGVDNLKTTLADRDREIARLETELRKCHLRAFDAVSKVCKRLGLSAEQSRELTGAALDPEEELARDSAHSHRAAAGE